MCADASFLPEAEERASVEGLIASLMARRRVNAAAVERARRLAAENGERIDQALVQLGLLGERELATAYADYLHVPLVTPDRLPAQPLLADRLKPKFLTKARMLPLVVEDSRLSLAVVDPFDIATRKAIALVTGLVVDIAIAVPIELETMFERLYPEWHAPESPSPDAPPPDSSVLAEDTERLRDLASEAPVIRLVNQIVGRAVETQASDIHLEPFEGRLRVRYRYDGVLHEAEGPPAHLASAVISRVKIMARLDIAERRLPQDGRLTLAVRGQQVDFRVSTIPSLHGEAVALRVLDRHAVEFDFTKLGLPKGVTAQLLRSLALPNGIVLVTGPTGSGKTTTLYTGLLQINSVARKIITAEDPVEYQLAGINQIQVKPQINLTFASLLRSILRQDPDVVMVGEIRDLETAEIAAQAALTGHLVLSTVHTNSAAATITRLRDMGLEDYLVTAVLRGVMAQRLVRRLCRHCRRPNRAAPEFAARFALDRLAPGSHVLHEAVGCSQCRGTGYRGRMAIAEFLVPDDVVRGLILSRADHAAIERAAVAAGMMPLFDAGLSAALAGETTIEEIVRSIHVEA